MSDDAAVELRRKKAEYQRRWREKNQDKWDAYMAKWRAEHRDHYLAYAKKWAAEHPEQCRENQKRQRKTANWLEGNRRRCKRWRERHPDKVSEKSKRDRLKAGPDGARQHRQARRAREASGRSGHVSYVTVRRRSKGNCAICRENFRVFDALHYDHIVPLARGGTHTTDNIQLVHAECNLRKGTRLMEELQNAAT